MAIDTSQGWVPFIKPILFFDELYKLSRTLPYTVTKNGLIRARISPNLEKQMCDFYDLPLDVGFYQTPPGWSYPFHADNTRYCAFNQLLCEPNPAYICKMKFSEAILDIPYSYTTAYAINTGMEHNVSNTTTDSTRYLLNIGVDEFIPFDTVINHLKNKGLV